MKNNILRSHIFGGLLLLSSLAPMASAGTIAADIAGPFGGPPTFSVQWSTNGIFSTGGPQSVRILPNPTSGQAAHNGTFDLFNLQLVGPEIPNLGVTSQQMVGGGFALRDVADVLELGGQSRPGISAVLSKTASGTGSVLTLIRWDLTGSLAASLGISEGDLALALNNIVEFAPGQYRAGATAIIDGSAAAVPEPGTVLGGLCAIGLLGWNVRKKIAGIPAAIRNSLGRAVGNIVAVYANGGLTAVSRRAISIRA